MKHVYVAPHSDDAVLSCGGAIHRQAAAGEAVQVVTLCGAEAEPGRPLSAFALEQHEHWGHPPRPMALRRAEDGAALTLLSAEAWHLDYLDAVYRRGAEGQALYPDLDSLYGPLHPQDPILPEARGRLAERLAGLLPRDGEATVYFPLGIGRHVDHQLAHLAGRALLAAGRRVAFYEDYPYAEWPGALDVALAAAGAGDWRLEMRPLDAADLAAKVSALAYYRSQLAVLFGGSEAMIGRVWAFAASRSPADGLVEGIWWPADAGTERDRA